MWWLLATARDLQIILHVFGKLMAISKYNRNGFENSKTDILSIMTS